MRRISSRSSWTRRLNRYLTDPVALAKLFYSAVARVYEESDRPLSESAMANMSDLTTAEGEILVKVCAEYRPS